MISPPANAVGLERRLFQALADRFGFHMTRRELVENLYASRDDGGPETAENIIRVVACRLRKKLVATPYEIRSEYARGYALILKGGECSVDETMGASHEV